MTTARICLGCKQPVIDEKVKHSPGCKVKLELQEQRESAELLAKILANKADYGVFLQESIAKHLIKLHQLAMRGSHRSAQQFREGALDILELLNAEGEKRDSQAPSVPRKLALDQQSRTGRGEAAPVRAVDDPPVGVAEGEGRGGAPDHSDEG